MSFQYLKTEEIGAVGVVTLDRASKRNAIDEATLAEIEAYFSSVPSHIKAILLMADGDHFCAGLDLKEHFDKKRTPVEFMRVCQGWHRAFDKIQFGGIPVIACLQGAVVGGGLELASAAHPELLYVEAGTQRVGYQAQLDSALARHAGQSLTQIQVPQAANRATVFLFTATNGLPYPAFVNPYTGAYLGSVAPAWWLPGTSRALHGGWPLGNGGSYLLELGACWAIVMILTGLYLWWPRRAVSGTSLPAAATTALLPGNDA